MSKRHILLAGSLCLTLASALVWAHDDNAADGSKADNKNLLHDTPNPDGHIPSNVNYGFSVIGRDTLGGVADGKYTDVWAYGGYAYIGTFEEPACDRSGVYISDIRDPANPTTVGMIKSPPNTRINDVKVHQVGDKTVLIHSLEPCGPLVGQGNAFGGGNGGSQQGRSGISLWDVTDPTNPHALKQNFLDFPVHNTFAWTTAAGNTYLMIVDDINVDDVHIADITKPQAPKVIANTGIGTWLETNPEVGADGQLFTGVFAVPLLHDIWINDLDPGPGEDWQAVLSYWDAGFITLDVNDPANPIFLGDSTYPAVDPVFGISPAEGNAHAAVFGGPGFDKIFGGDEDFDAFFTAVIVENTEYSASQGSDVPQVGPGAGIESLTGDTVFVGLACGDPIPAAPSASSIAVIERGVCAFTTKAQTVEAAGYSAGIVFNGVAPDRCDASVSMLVEAGIPMVFVARSAGFGILGIDGYDPDQCGATDGTNPALPAISTPGLVSTIGAAFDGWGYLHVLNNVDGQVTVPKGMGENAQDPVTVGYLGEIGYYAPAELTNPALAVGFGDLTMHNLEIDPQEPNRVFISWYSLGMRAVEWRPGHYHTNSLGEGVVSWNIHEVGRFIAGSEFGEAEGSNFWGVTVTEINGEQYILGTDRNTGLWILQWTCEDATSTLYCNAPTP